MRITTKKGDFGKTSLLGGQIVDKDHPVLELIGQIDELSAVLGMIRAKEKDEGNKQIILSIQKANFLLSKELMELDSKDINKESKDMKPYFDFIEKQSSDLEEILTNEGGWKIPGETELEAGYDFARVHARKLERRLVGYLKLMPTDNRFYIAYLNRLSDLLWLMGLKSLQL
ncbi:MAG: ATP:cob(I)alamin adenosyltransferase, partial [Deltaproteobacteria bacterium]|nr:ATP:cob(I)alamin adenosyltransferase [Deltaproteobacteria bacterium]